MYSSGLRVLQQYKQEFKKLHLSTVCWGHHNRSCEKLRAPTLCSDIRSTRYRFLRHESQVEWWSLSYYVNSLYECVLHPRAMPNRIHSRNANADAPTTAENALVTSTACTKSRACVHTRLLRLPATSTSHNRSNLLRKFLVRRINFLYLCFFIFSFRCLFTLIALHISRIFSILPSSHLSCRSRILSRNG